MKVNEAEKKEEPKLNEQRLTDLPVSEEQADETKGGTVVTDYALLECRFRESNPK